MDSANETVLDQLTSCGVFLTVFLATAPAQEMGLWSCPGASMALLWPLYDSPLLGLQHLTGKMEESAVWAALRP